MQPADIRSLTEAYQGIYKEKVDLTEENIDEDLLDESFDELVDELIEEGYSEEEAIEIVDEATDLYIDSVLCEVSDSYYDSAVRASKKAARGIDKAARQKRRAGQVRYAKRKVGDAIKSVKAKAKGAVAGAQIAGSIAKDEARRAGRKAAHAVTSAPGKAKATVDRKKKETKRGIKGFIKRQAEKVVKRMSEGYDEPKMHKAVKRVMTTQPAAKGRAASRLHSKYSMRSKGNVAGETDGPGPNAPKRSGRKGRGAETDRGSGNAAKRRMNTEESAMSPGEVALQKKKAMIDKMIASKRMQGLKKSPEAPAKAMGEETEDSLRDKRQERGGVDGNTRYDRPAKNVATGPAKKKSSGMSALDFVKADIRSKYGKGAIIDTKKK